MRPQLRKHVLGHLHIQRHGIRVPEHSGVLCVLDPLLDRARRRLQDRIDVRARDAPLGRAQDRAVRFPLVPRFVQDGDAADCGFTDRGGKAGFGADRADERVPAFAC
jgi:hypothetical protein